MASVSALNQTAVREDLSDELSVADAKSTPVTSMIRKSKAPTNNLYSWPVAGIPTPDASAVADGTPVSGTRNNSGNRATLSNYIQWVRDTFAVTKLAESNDVAGINNEYEDSKMRTLEAVKRAIELIFCSDQDADLTAAAYKTRGLGAYIKATAGSTLPIDSNYLTPAASIYGGTTAAFSETAFNAVMQSIYSQTGRNGNFDCPVGADLKARITLMSVYTPDVASNTFVRRFNSSPNDNNTIDTTVDVVKGDFGTARVHTTLFAGWAGTSPTAPTAKSKRGYVLDLSDISMRNKEMPGHKELPEDGSGRRGMVDAVVGLQLGNPLKHGKIAPSDE